MNNKQLKITVQTPSTELLEPFLYEAILIPPGLAAPPREIIFEPRVYVYIEDFGRKDDICMVAEADGRVVGAAWSRILADPAKRGFGNIDSCTPELAVSVLPEYRGHGIGTQLIDTLHRELLQRGYKRISLSVQKTNAAERLYRRLGYAVIDENDEDYIMLCNLGEIRNIKKKALRLVKKKIALAGSVNERNEPLIKAMLVARRESLRTFYFASNLSSIRVEQYRRNPNACLYFYNSLVYKGVMLEGRMEVLTDEATRRMIWKRSMNSMYQGGVNDPDYCVLRFTAKRGRYYFWGKTQWFEVGDGVETK